MLRMQFLKKLVYMTIFITIEVVNIQDMVEGMVDAFSHLEIDLLVSFVQNMVML